MQNINKPRRDSRVNHAVFAILNSLSQMIATLPRETDMPIPNRTLEFLRKGSLTSAVAAMVLAAGCNTQPLKEQTSPISSNVDPDRLLIVDCMLPGQVKQLGSKLTYLTPRRPLKSSAVDCEIRGGEYVSYDRANYATALKIWLPKAQEGDAEAQNYVGEIYEKGLGIQADYAIAHQWYLKAAEQGDSRAQINLGYLYESGLGVERNLTTAMNWYRRASGLTEGELEFVSSIEQAQRDAAKIESAELRQEVGQLRTQLATTKAELQRRQGDIASSQTRISSLKAELETRRRELAGSPSPAPSATPSPGEAAKTAQIERELATARAEQERLASRLSEQQLQTAALKAQLSSAQAKLIQQQDSLSDTQTQISLANQQLATLESTASSGARLHSAQIARLKAEIAKYRTEAKGREAAIQQLRAQESDGERQLREQLSKEQSSQEQLERQLAQSQQEQERLQSRLASVQLDSANSDRRIRELEQEIATAEAKLNKQETDITALQGELTKQQAQVSTAQSEKVVAAVEVGPAIEIIEPPLRLTRGEASAFLPGPLTSVDIIGRVAAKEGVLAFQINGTKYDLDSNGLFQVTQTISGESQPVSVVAVDKSGKRNTLDFTLIPRSGKDSGRREAPTTDTSTPRLDVNFGRYHALIIGNNGYKNLTNLRTATNDATEIDKILRSKYGFETTLLLDATRYDILTALNNLRATLTEEDNLLIYYAGHGELDRVNLRGYWLPVDAEPDNSTNWISNVAVTDILNAMTAKHVLVVADSCYSGALTRSSVARLESGMSETKRNKWYQAMSKARARAVLTSGGIQPVLDAGGGAHSLFAKAFIDTLRHNDTIMEGFRLFREVQKRMKPVTAHLNVEQNPQYSPIKYAGHEAGEFFLLPKGTRVSTVAYPDGPRMAAR